METNQRVTYTLRLNSELRDWLAKRAKKSDLSMNAEIVRILRNQKEAEGQEPKPTSEGAV